MTIIYVVENNCQSLAVTFRNNKIVTVQKLEDVSSDENIIYEVNPIGVFIGKSHECDMTEFSGANNREVFDGNTFLLNIGKENNKYIDVYIGGD